MTMVEQLAVSGLFDLKQKAFTRQIAQAFKAGKVIVSEVEKHQVICLRSRVNRWGKRNGLQTSVKSALESRGMQSGRVQVTIFFG